MVNLNMQGFKSSETNIILEKPSKCHRSML